MNEKQVRRFWAKVFPLRGHWIWFAYRDEDGYGRYSLGRSTFRAHRLAYQELVGPIPEGLQIDHLCRVRSCVNPSHLEPVTNAENIRRGETGKVRGAQMRAKTHCPCGREYAGANLLIDSNSRRRCRFCTRKHNREYARRRRGKIKQEQTL